MFSPDPQKAASAEAGARMLLVERIHNSTDGVAVLTDSTSSPVSELQEPPSADVFLALPAVDPEKMALGVNSGVLRLVVATEPHHLVGISFYAFQTGPAVLVSLYNLDMLYPRSQVINGLSPGRQVWLRDPLVRASGSGGGRTVRVDVPSAVLLVLTDAPRCSQFGCKSPGTQRCSSCKCVSYCSQQCQKGNWKVHKRFCTRQHTVKSLKEAMGPITQNIGQIQWMSPAIEVRPSPLCGMLGDGVFATRNMRCGEVLTVETPLVHCDEHTEDGANPMTGPVPLVLHVINNFTPFHTCIRRLLDIPVHHVRLASNATVFADIVRRLEASGVILNKNGFHPALVHKVFHTIDRNVFGIVGEQVPGYCGSALTSLSRSFNHSCLPSATWNFLGVAQENRQVVYLTRNVAAGDEVLLRYHPLGVPFDRHCFQCCCELCRNDAAAMSMRVGEDVSVPPLTLQERYIALQLEKRQSMQALLKTPEMGKTRGKALRRAIRATQCEIVRLTKLLTGPGSALADMLAWGLTFGPDLGDRFPQVCDFFQSHGFVPLSTFLRSYVGGVTDALTARVEAGRRGEKDEATF